MKDDKDTPISTGLRSELRVTMPRDLYREIVRLAKREDRKVVDWTRRKLRAIVQAEQEAQS